MQLIPPSKFELYGGAGKNAYPSNDKSFFWSCCATGPRGFGLYVFHQVGNGLSTEVNYGPLMTGRGTLTLGGDGLLYITGNDALSRAFVYVIPGYVRYTTQGAIPVPIPIITPVIDAEARRLATDAQTDANSAYKRATDALTKAGTALARPDVSDNHIADIAWVKAHDAIFAETQDSNSNLAKWVWQKCLDGAYATLKQHGLVK